MFSDKTFSKETSISNVELLVLLIIHLNCRVISCLSPLLSAESSKAYDFLLFRFPVTVKLSYLLTTFELISGT